MTNRWLDISLDEYESHMRAPDVAQADVLRELFAIALTTAAPRSVAVLGVAGGNGLDVVDPGTVTRVVGVDINPLYLEATRIRFATIPNLELHRVDLAHETIAIEPVDLVHAALIFEHAGTARCLENALAMVGTGGWLSVVLQLATGQDCAAPPSVASSLRGKLGSQFSLIDRESFVRQLETRGCDLVAQTTRPLPQAKAFWHGLFRRSEPSLHPNSD